jgi:hypothetical protein
MPRERPRARGTGPAEVQAIAQLGPLACRRGLATGGGVFRMLAMKKIRLTGRSRTVRRGSAA